MVVGQREVSGETTTLLDLREPYSEHLDSIRGDSTLSRWYDALYRLPILHPTKTRYQFEEDVVGQYWTPSKVELQRSVIRSIRAMNQMGEKYWQLDLLDGVERPTYVMASSSL
jgi:hypothetical protein